MAGAIVQRRVVYTSIHFTDHPCGDLGPSTDRWRYVTCVPCLRAAPKDPRIEARLAAVLAEAAEREKP